MYNAASKCQGDILGILPLYKKSLYLATLACFTAASPQCFGRESTCSRRAVGSLLLQLWTSLRCAVTLTCLRSRCVAFSEGSMVLK